MLFLTEQFDDNDVRNGVYAGKVAHWLGDRCNLHISAFRTVIFRIVS